MKDVVLADVTNELAQQDQKWGEQNHPDGTGYKAFTASADRWKDLNNSRVEECRLTWDGILLEEVYEALAESDPIKLRAELVQVAAVAMNWIKAIDRRSETPS